MSLPEQPDNPDKPDEPGKAGVTSEAASAVAQVRAARTVRSIMKSVTLVTLVSLLAVISILLLTASWTYWTQSGTSMMLQVAQYVSAGSFKLTGLRGRLADELQFDELSYKSKTSQVLASGVSLTWRPRSLLGGKLEIDQLAISALRLANVPNRAPAQLPLDLYVPLSIQVKKASVGRLTVATLNADGSASPVVELSEVTASLDSTRSQHQIQGALVSPWGRLELQTAIASARPFSVTGQFSYLGQANPSIPLLGMRGSLAGSLEALRITASAMTPEAVPALTQAAGSLHPLSSATSIRSAPPERPATNTKQPGQVSRTRQVKAEAQAKPLQGGFDLLLSIFSAQPLRALQANITGLNPADFAVAAPQADLTVKANLAIPDVNKPTAEKSPDSGMVLAGSVEISNASAGRLDQRSLPVLSLRSDVRLATDLVQLTATQIQLPGKGKISGAANIRLPVTGVPLLDSHFVLSAIDLAIIDQRLQPTQISGTVDAQTSIENLQQNAQDPQDPQDPQVTKAVANAGSTTLLTMQAQLKDPRASLKAEASYEMRGASAAGVLKLVRFELLAANSRVQGQGEIDLADTQAFNFQGKLLQFDPARWLKGPKGSIDADLSFKGQLQPALQLAIAMPRLQGRYAGQELSGQVALDWQGGGVLLVQKADLLWGKNTLNAQGAWGSAKDNLQLKLDVPDLSVLSPLIGLGLTGNVQAEAQLHGKFSELAGKLTVSAQGAGIEEQFSLGKFNADITLANGPQGEVSVDLSAQELRVNRGAPELAAQSGTKLQLTTQAQPAVLPDAALRKKTSRLTLLAEQLDLTIKGRRDAHQIDLDTRFNTARRLRLTAAGGLKIAAGKAPQWVGQLGSLDLAGQPGLKLLAPALLQIGQQEVRIGPAQLTGAAGQLTIEQFEWMPDSIKSRGKMSHVKIMDLLNLISPQALVAGDLQIGADWDVQLTDNVSGQLRILRESGDLRIKDTDGTARPLPLEMNDFKLNVALGGTGAGTGAGRIAVKMTSSGARLGKWALDVRTELARTAGQWTLSPEAPMEGEAHADVPDLQWLGPWLNPGLALKGKLKVDASLGGIIKAPRYEARIEGRELEAAFASEGLLLPNGTLSARLNEKSLKVTQLQFSNKVATMPRHAKFREINWVGQKGELNATGEIDFRQQSGSIAVNFQKFPLLQRKDRWLVVSGQTSIVQDSDTWALSGKINADGAYFRLPKLPPPALSSDVIVLRGSDKNGPAGAPADEAKKGLKTRLDISFDMGPTFVFVGSGIDTGLAGSIRLRSNDGAPLHATGSIQTVGGAYEGYGQQLAIERGILNFQGAPGNPALNIRALRTGLEVEAGVEVFGTVSAPQVRLVSEPGVPDAEKLSWLVLGRGSNQIAGADASLLMSAAGAIFGGDGSRNIPRDIVQGLGFDEFSVGAADVAGSSRLPGQTVAGATSVNASTTANQVVSVGKRLAPGLVLSVERGLTDASGAVRLSWQLTRRISIIGRSGTDASVDAYYTFSFH